MRYEFIDAMNAQLRGIMKQIRDRENRWLYLTGKPQRTAAEQAELDRDFPLADDEEPIYPY